MSDKRASAMGGVRNLRAMFENKDDSASPPDRGRSPGDSIGGGSNGTSPRPLSKVRTSFIAVENKNGQWGLRRDTSGEPSLAKRRTSFSIDEEDNPIATKERKESIAEEFAARKNSIMIEETVPESAIETPSIEADKQLGGPAQKKEPLSKAMHKANTSKPTEVESKKDPTNGAANGHAKSKEATKPEQASKTNGRPAPISTSKTTMASKPSPKPIKSPAVKPPKTPTSPQKSSLNPSAKDPVKKSTKASLEPAHTSKSSRQPSNGSASAVPPKLKIQSSPPKTGFVKPKPRSPTRPVKLPASLTAHTASSGSKTAAASPPSRQSLSRASGNIQHTTTVARSPSRATGPKTLTRKPSTTRPSLGPPPSTLKKQPSRQSLPGPADESFLARMMRPTTSSESKKAEKVPDTPPKRSQSVKRPATRDGPPKMHAISNHGTTAPKAVKGAAPSKATTKEAPKKVVEAPKSAPVVKRPTPEPKSTVEEPKVETPAMEEPKVEKPIEENKAEETKVKEPLVEKSKNEEVKIEEPKVETAVPSSVEIQADEPKIEEAVVPEPEAEAPQIEEPKIDLPKVDEPEIAPAQDSAAADAEPVAIAKDEPLIPAAIEAVETKGLPVISEPEITKKVEEPKAKTVVEEDPEDVKAREEIARLNAEIMGASPVSEVVRVSTDQNEGLESY